MDPQIHRARLSKRQRGNAMLVALIALTGLATLGAITVGSVQTGLTSANAERSATIARYAAESGVWASLDYLRTTVYADEVIFFSFVTRPSNVDPEDMPGLAGNRALPGSADNPFSPDMKAWYDVMILNNITDPKFAVVAPADTEDSDGQVMLRSTGHGPDGAVITLEVDVKFIDPDGAAPIDPTTFVILAWRDVL